MSRRASGRSADYVGRGPHENYADRKASAFVGRYGGALASLARSHVRPGEFGGRDDCRVLDTSGRGGGLRVKSDTPFHWSVHRFTVETLARARHAIDLPAAGRAYLWRAHRHLGVGGDIGWGKSVRPEFVVGPGVCRWSVTLEASPDRPLRDRRPDARPLRVARVSRALDADCTCIAWSGKTVGPANGLPECYDRTLR